MEAERGGWRPKEVERVEGEMEATKRVAGQVGEGMEMEGRRKLDTVVEDVKRVRFAYSSSALRCESLMIDGSSSIENSTSIYATFSTDKPSSESTTLTS